MKINTSGGQEFQLERKESSYLINGVELKNAVVTLKNDGFLYIHLEERVLKGWVESFNKEKKEIVINLDSHVIVYKLIDRFDDLLKELGIDKLAQNTQDVLKAPMPGKVVEVIVKEGDEVNEGDHLLILEAMKMENVLKASGASKVHKIHVEQGNTVEKNKVLIEFE